VRLSDRVDEATCGCGCGTSVTCGGWVVGHDQRALLARIREDVGGFVRRSIDWYDANGPSPLTPEHAAGGGTLDPITDLADVGDDSDAPEVGPAGTALA
jgi:hypothetical protein